MQDQLLRFPEVRRLVGLSRSTVWRLERTGQFPARRKVSSNAVAWLRSEVEAWAKKLINADCVPTSNEKARSRNGGRHE